METNRPIDSSEAVFFVEIRSGWEVLTHANMTFAGRIRSIRNIESKQSSRKYYILMDKSSWAHKPWATEDERCTNETMQRREISSSSAAFPLPHIMCASLIIQPTNGIAKPRRRHVGGGEGEGQAEAPRVKDI